jgi:hypothetical protein
MDLQHCLHWLHTTLRDLEPTHPQYARVAKLVVVKEVVVVALVDTLGCTASSRSTIRTCVSHVTPVGRG